MKSLPRCLLFLIVAFLALVPAFLQAQEEIKEIGEPIKFEEEFDKAVGPIANLWASIVFWTIPGINVPLVLVLLAGTAIFLTIYFRFINLTGFRVALRTATGKYSNPNSPGQITHFQALTTALSATVGLGNIAGVAVAIGIGGPGATFWMILLGLCGMTTKFAECTLGVKYRKIDEEGQVHGGAMYYLSEGLKAEGRGDVGEFMSKLAPILAVAFSVFVIGGAFGAGNMFQANQAYGQFANVMPPDFPKESYGLLFGAVMAVLVGLVILGGIVSIARVTSILVPFMCAGYLIAAIFIILANLGNLGPAFGEIFRGAFDGTAVAGGIVGVLIQGIKRAAFSNEAGLGSAPIAHSAVKTDKPASEGFVALLEPFTDTVVVCTMTALVIIISGTWRASYEVDAETAQIFAEPGTGEVVQTVPKGQYLHTRNDKLIGKPGGDEKWIEVIGLVSPEEYENTPIQGWVREDQVANQIGVALTSKAFASVIGWFPVLLTVAVFLFAFSTMIAWSYYGQQGVYYLFKRGGTALADRAIIVYRVIFCLVIVVGATASFDNVILLSDAMVFSMVLPNLIGLYFLLHVVRKESNLYLEFVRSQDAKPSTGFNDGNDSAP